MIFCRVRAKMFRMNDNNPYASPLSAGRPVRSEADTIAVEAVPPPWRWRDYVLLPSECALPELCVRCGAPSDRPLRSEKVKWFSPALFAFVPLTIPVMISGQKNGHVFYTLCAKHDGVRTARVRVAWVLGAVAVADFLLGMTLTMTLQTGWPVFLMIAAFFTLLLAVAIPAIMPGVLRVHRIDKGVVWLRLLPRQFYAHLPQLPSADGRNPIIPHFELTDG